MQAFFGFFFAQGELVSRRKWHQQQGRGARAGRKTAGEFHACPAPLLLHPALLSASSGSSRNLCQEEQRGQPSAEVSLCGWKA